MLKLNLFIAALSMLFLTGFSQNIHETVPATGGNATGTGGSVSYTVGQIVYTTNSAASGALAQGIQQPYEISEVIDGIEHSSKNINCSVYPNPTTDFIVLEMGNIADVVCQIFDANGKLVANQTITEATTNIDMSGLVSATYFLKIIQDGQIVKTFKIIKNK